MNGWIGAISKFIQNVGFPIAVAAYLIYRMDGILQKLTGSVDANTAMIAKLINFFIQPPPLP